MPVHTTSGQGADGAGGGSGRFSEMHAVVNTARTCAYDAHIARTHTFVYCFVCTRMRHMHARHRFGQFRRLQVSLCPVEPSSGVKRPKGRCRRYGRFGDSVRAENSVTLRTAHSIPADCAVGATEA